MDETQIVYTHSVIGIKGGWALQTITVLDFSESVSLRK
jgi:hypothetical protein